MVLMFFLIAIDIKHVFQVMHIFLLFNLLDMTFAHKQ